MSQVTTHILDTSRGKPAEGVRVILYMQLQNGWKELANSTTNRDGRVSDMLKKEILLEDGEYKLRFETKAYYDKHHTATFYPYVEIAFLINAAEHYHVPLLINPFGFSTYRGS
jgi:5-hydroxyisourate hydrolase